MSGIEIVVLIGARIFIGFINTLSGGGFCYHSFPINPFGITCKYCQWN